VQTTDVTCESDKLIAIVVITLLSSGEFIDVLKLSWAELKLLTIVIFIIILLIIYCLPYIGE